MVKPYPAPDRLYVGVGCSYADASRPSPTRRVSGCRHFRVDPIPLTIFAKEEGAEVKGQGKFPRENLARIKKTPKQLDGLAFTPHKKNRFPAPWQHLPLSRRMTTGLIQVADDLHVGFIARSGEHYDQRALYGCLFKGEASGPVTPLLRMDWHPSHKGLHAVVNCEDERDLRGRNVGGKELDLASYGISFLDPDSDQDRLQFVNIFCDACNITLGGKGLFS